MLVQEFSSVGMGEARAPVEAELLDALAARAGNGERAAFGEIYSLLVDDVYAYVRSQVQSDTVAEDIVADVFLRGWRSAKTYRVGENYRRWIFAITRNELRRAWRKAPPPGEELAATLVEPDASLAEPSDARRLVAHGLSRLTAEQREVVILRYFMGRSHAEIAAIVGKREGATRALLLRALRRMKRVLDDAAT